MTSSAAPALLGATFPLIRSIVPPPCSAPLSVTRAAALLLDSVSAFRSFTLPPLSRHCLTLSRSAIAPSRASPNDFPRFACPTSSYNSFALLVTRSLLILPRRPNVAVPGNRLLGLAFDCILSVATSAGISGSLLL